MHYLIGLGNPDTAYNDTPHNAGRIIADTLRARWQCGEFTHDRHLSALRAACGDVEVILPETYMNRSGQTVRALVSNTADETLLQRIIVLQDDIDLPRGRIKIVAQGGSGGHRGVASIIQMLGTDQVLRVKIGIAPVDDEGQIRKPQGDGAVTEYVLRPQPRLAKQLREEVAERVEKAIDTLIHDGVEKAMSLYNER